MEWVDGARLNDKQKLQEMGLDGTKFVDTLVQCSLRQLLENGFFHADPHAGNLLAMQSGKLCYLDFGMVSYVESGKAYSNHNYIYYSDILFYDRKYLII